MESGLLGTYLEPSSYGYLFLFMLLSRVSIHRMNVGCTCTYNSCSSSPAWTSPKYYSRNQNIALNQIIPFEMAFYHDIFSVGINILHTCWHISQRYALSRVSIFSRLSSKSSYLSKRFLSQVFLVFWMLISFIMVAYFTISSFLTHYILRGF